MKGCKVGCVALEIDRRVNKRVKCSAIYADIYLFFILWVQIPLEFPLSFCGPNSMTRTQVDVSSEASSIHALMELLAVEIAYFYLLLFRKQLLLLLLSLLWNKQKCLQKNQWMLLHVLKRNLNQSQVKLQSPQKVCLFNYFEDLMWLW